MAVLNNPEKAEVDKNDKITTKTKLNNKQLKKKAKKKKKKDKSIVNSIVTKEVEGSTDDLDVKVEIEFVPDKIEVFARHEPYFEFNRVFEKFKMVDVSKAGSGQSEDATDKSKNIKKLDDVPIKARGFLEDDEDLDKDKTEEKPKMSKKKMKKLNRLTVAELKQLVSRPDVVEMHDVTSRDPKLLVCLKASRNTVSVPRHWCFKRKYLQGKRGFEKPPFELPHFIKATGIMEMRQALQEKEDQKTLKSKMRERVRPKMGKIDIDYQKLHDAFFKWQTKPRMSIHGDIYYEGKEFETRLKEKKPGNLSDDLRTALGMPIGPNADKYPPPWLIAMQRYGPPPSYPNLKIPGLNAPIPDGTSFGYHAGGWGKPPVDETGKPLYGDVFGPSVNEPNAPAREDEVNKNFWGEMESESEDESEEEEEEKEGEEPDMTGLVTPGETGLATPSGTTSVMTLGMETPESIELRKKRIEDAMDQGGDTPNLYTILPERRVGAGAAMMGSTHVYDIPTPAAPAATTTGKKASGEGIEVVLEPEELDLDMAAMKAKYDQTLREQQSNLSKEDLSDMVAEHQAKQQKKRKKQAQSNQDTSTSKSKKAKDFKF